MLALIPHRSFAFFVRQTSRLDIRFKCGRRHCRDQRARFSEIAKKSIRSSTRCTSIDDSSHELPRIELANINHA